MSLYKHTDTGGYSQASSSSQWVTRDQAPKLQSQTWQRPETRWALSRHWLLSPFPSRHTLPQGTAFNFIPLHWRARLTDVKEVEPGAVLMHLNCCRFVRHQVACEPRLVNILVTELPGAKTSFPWKASSPVFIPTRLLDLKPHTLVSKVSRTQRKSQLTTPLPSSASCKKSVMSKKVSLVSCPREEGHLPPWPMPSRKWNYKTDLGSEYKGSHWKQLQEAVVYGDWTRNDPSADSLTWRATRLLLTYYCGNILSLQLMIFSKLLSKTLFSGRRWSARAQILSNLREKC